MAAKTLKELISDEYVKCAKDPVYFFFVKLNINKTQK